MRSTAPTSRRKALLGLGAWACAGQLPARAQTQQPRRYAVISLIGDEVVLVYSSAVTGSKLDRNRHRVLPDAAGSFDQVALSAVGQALEAGGAAATLLNVPPSSLHQKPEQVVSGSEIGLTDALVAQIEQAQATHVVLLTKLRAPTRIQLADGQVGVGSLRGLGYYVDRRIDLQVNGKGAMGEGMLAPYAYVQLTLADARDGRVLNTRYLHATQVHAAAQNPDITDPWDLLTAEQKVGYLRQLLRKSLASEIPALVAG